VWGFVFFGVFFATCVVQRKRVIPLYTGLVSLYHGQSAFDATNPAGTYQRVATNPSDSGLKSASTKKAMPATGVGGAGRAAAGGGVSNYTIGDMEDDDEDDAGFSAEL